jgi:hypothetical protein
VLSAHDYCVRVLSDFVMAHEDPSTRLRVVHSIDLEASRLMFDAVSELSEGLPVLILASPEVAGIQARDWVRSAIAVGEIRAAVVCELVAHEVAGYVISATPFAHAESVELGDDSCWIGDKIREQVG